MLDENQQDNVVKVVSVCGDRFTAARFIDRDPGDITATAEADPEFAERLRRAEASLELGHLKHIEDAGKDNWRASAWLLERVFPDRYAHRRSEVLTRKQVAQSLRAFSNVVLEEVRGVRQREKILRRMQQLVQNLGAPDGESS
jgi:hypothetical protein